MDEKSTILQILECAYIGAKNNNDPEMMCRISRAIVAFSYDDLISIPTWEKMLNDYITKVCV